MKDIEIAALKKKLMDDVSAPYLMLNEAFDVFNKKWAAAQKTSALDRKDMDALILEALDEAIPEQK